MDIGLGYYVKAYSRFSTASETKSEKFAGWATANLAVGVNGKFDSERTWNANLAFENMFDTKYKRPREAFNAAGRNLSINVGMKF